MLFIFHLSRSAPPCYAPQSKPFLLFWEHHNSTTPVFSPVRPNINLPAPFFCHYNFCSPLLFQPSRFIHRHRPSRRRSRNLNALCKFVRSFNLQPMTNPTPPSLSFIPFPIAFHGTPLRASPHPSARKSVLAQRHGCVIKVSGRIPSFVYCRL